MSQGIELSVNGTGYAVDVPPDHPLLGVLREQLGLTGCKIGCGEGTCGACTVLVDDRVTRSCITSVGDVSGRPIRTIEGLEDNGSLHPIQQAGHIRAIHHQQIAQFPLAHAIRARRQHVEDVVLRRRESMWPEQALAFPEENIGGRHHRRREFIGMFPAHGDNGCDAYC